MQRVNCWEHKRCGRQPGGIWTNELGVCPVATEQKFNGVHGGTNAGRACWAVAGSLCNGKVQGSYAQKLADCWRCDFFNAVKGQEEPTSEGFQISRLSIEKFLERSVRGKHDAPSKKH